MKANLARFTMALVLLAAMALSLGAGVRWSSATMIDTDNVAPTVQADTAYSSMKGHRWF